MLKHCVEPLLFLRVFRSAKMIAANFTGSKHPVDLYHGERAELAVFGGQEVVHRFALIRKPFVGVNAVSGVRPWKWAGDIKGNFPGISILQFFRFSRLTSFARLHEMPLLRAAQRDGFHSHPPPFPALRHRIEA